jgi:manganese transport protein
MQLGFAVIPLIHFVSDKEKMGIYAIHWFIKILAWLVAAILVYLNTRLVVEQLMELVKAYPGMLTMICCAIAFLLFVGLIIYIVVFPWLPKHFKKSTTDFHGAEVELDFAVATQPIERVAIAVDFSTTDAKLIKVALQQVVKENAMIHIIHVVESATAKYHQDASDDEESRKDQQRLELYAEAIRKNGYKVTTHLGYQKRVKEIVRIVETEQAQLLVMGSHSHKGIKDFLFGETIESVRHAVSMPVLVVNR